MLTVSYTATRGELWRWYKRAWRMGLWVAHLLTIVFVVSTCLLLQIFDTTLPNLLLGLGVGIVIAGFMIAWPQLRYRAEERVLRFGVEGIDYVRGAQSGTLPWSRVRTIASWNGSVVVASKSFNAFIIPLRAFGDEEAADRALVTLESLHHAGR